MTWLADAVLDGMLEALQLLGRVVLFVLPVLVGLELARTLGWLQALERRAEPACRRLGLPSGLAPALTAGTALGVILGSGVVIQTARRLRLDRRTLNIFFVFIGIFHAMFEETAIVTSLGGNGVIMVVTRFAFGLLAAWVYRALTARLAAPAPEAATTTPAASALPAARPGP